MAYRGFRKGLLPVVLLGYVASGGEAAGQNLPQAIDLDAPATLDSVVAKLAAKRVVFIGETHDRYDHHLNQLDLIRRFYQIDPKLAIGVEYFPEGFQPQVDDYIGGRATEDQFLRGVNYFRTWGYDYRLYEPIFRFAREHRIPVRALNASAGVASAVAKVGMGGFPNSSAPSYRTRSSPPTKGIKPACLRRSRSTEE